MHNGDTLQPTSVAGLTIEEVTHENVLDYQIAKLKGFANSEEQPDPADVESGLRLRRKELADNGRFLIARLESEPASIIGWYEGEDRVIFHLATRIPFRNRGLAKHLLCHVVSETYRMGYRSVMLFTDPLDTPINLYHRLGFTDEIYWRGRYDFTP